MLSNFTEEERDGYRERLLVDDEDLKVVEPRDKVVLLDDRVISGQQQQKVFRKLLDQRPDLKGSVEIQLVAAGEDRIENGLKYIHTDYQEVRIPVRAYYKAHRAEYGGDGVYLTGATSSADLDFENILRDMVRELRTRGISGAELPPLTNIVRPYHDLSIEAGEKALPEKQK